MAEYPRAGDTRDGIVIVKGIETIDASAVDPSFVGHTYFGDSASVIADIGALLRRGTAADERRRPRAVADKAGRSSVFEAGS